MKFYRLVAIVIVVLAAAVSAHASNRRPSITITALNVSSSIVQFPLTRTSWAIDPWERKVGHLEGTAGLSESGNIVLAGHSKLPNGKPGIFGALHRLSAGDEVVVFDGVNERRYVVSQVFTVGAEDVSVVYPTSGERLTLITCDASSFNAASSLYDRRVVVVAEPAG